MMGWPPIVSLLALWIVLGALAVLLHFVGGLSWLVAAVVIGVAALITALVGSFSGYRRRRWP